MKYLILLLLLSGCSAQQFKKTGDNETVIIYWPKENRSYIAVRENCSDDAKGCIKPHSKDFSNAEMFAVEPMDAEDREAMCTLGHEYYHSIKGYWHD